MTARSKGQAVVEFAFVAPFLVILTLSTMYAGILFMDYIQYSNAARSAARDISLTDGFDKKRELVNDINAQKETLLNRYANQLTNLYNASWEAKLLKEDGKDATDESDASDVQISISLSINNGPDLIILPDNLKTIVYKMTLERKS